MKKFQIPIIKKMVGLPVMSIEQFLHPYSKVYWLRIVDDDVYAEYNFTGVKVKQIKSFNHGIGLLIEQGYCVVPDGVLHLIEYDQFRGIYNNGTWVYSNKMLDREFDVNNFDILDWLRSHSEYGWSQSVIHKISLLELGIKDIINSIDVFTMSIDNPPTPKRVDRNRKHCFFDYLKIMFRDELFLSGIKNKKLTIADFQLLYAKYYTDSFHINRLELPNFNLKLCDYDTSGYYEMSKPYNRQQSKLSLKLELGGVNL